MDSRVTTFKVDSPMLASSQYHLFYDRDLAFSELVLLVSCCLGQSLQALQFIEIHIESPQPDHLECVRTLDPMSSFSLLHYPQTYSQVEARYVVIFGEYLRAVGSFECGISQGTNCSRGFYTHQQILHEDKISA